MGTINIVVTDTFGGEANYSWVKRVTLDSKLNETTKQLIRRVKKELGYSGIPCEINDYFDMIEIRPKKICHVIFITFGED